MGNNNTRLREIAGSRVAMGHCSIATKQNYIAIDKPIHATKRQSDKQENAVREQWSIVACIAIDPSHTMISHGTVLQATQS